MMFRDQVGIVAGWFRGWSECEQTVALLALLKRVTRTQARFLQLCLEHSLADCPDIHLLEAEANSAAAISQWPQEPVVALLTVSLSLSPAAIS
ncbi:protein Smaug homolog 2-like, partial [Oenanthe melanoleuca]|uniref:protein Smaug homolog 2-like n=1 Tax=Oenanthe melanoleuca TaxID=2939378 RepID=UPI0024C0EFA8